MADSFTVLHGGTQWTGDRTKNLQYPRTRGFQEVSAGTAEWTAIYLRDGR